MERFYTYSRFLKERFGEKLYKISLNGGFTCPNRDGSKGMGGCIFCSQGGSGEYAESPRLSVTDQIMLGRSQSSAKYQSRRYIAYFQAFTGTYAPIDRLRSIYEEALALDQIAALSIATRPDCIPEETLLLLKELNRIKPVFIEMGLQTCHDRTADRLNRCYPTSVFTDTSARLKEAGLRVTAHVILGLPGETRAMHYETIDYLNRLKVDGVKMSMLYILENTELARQYLADPFPVFTADSYIDLLIECIERLDPRIVIERITGDAPSRLLIAPRWGLGKGEVLNRIRHEMKVRDSFQGKRLEHE